MGWWSGLKKVASVGSLIPGVNVVAGPMAAAMHGIDAGRSLKRGDWKGAVGGALGAIPGGSVAGLVGKAPGIGRAARAFQGLPGWAKAGAKIGGGALMGMLGNRGGSPGANPGAISIVPEGGYGRSRAPAYGGGFSPAEIERGMTPPIAPPLPPQFAGGGWVHPQANGAGQIVQLGDTPSGEEVVLPLGKLVNYLEARDGALIAAQDGVEVRRMPFGGDDFSEYSPLERLAIFGESPLNFPITPPIVSPTLPSSGPPRTFDYPSQSGRPVVDNQSLWHLIDDPGLLDSLETLYNLPVPSPEDGSILAETMPVGERDLPWYRDILNAVNTPTGRGIGSILGGLALSAFEKPRFQVSGPSRGPAPTYAEGVIIDNAPVGGLRGLIAEGGEPEWNGDANDVGELGITKEEIPAVLAQESASVANPFVRLRDIVPGFQEGVYMGEGFGGGAEEGKQAVRDLGYGTEKGADYGQSGYGQQSYGTDPYRSQKATWQNMVRSAAGAAPFNPNAQAHGAKWGGSQFATGGPGPGPGHGPGVSGAAPPVDPTDLNTDTNEGFKNNIEGAFKKNLGSAFAQYQEGLRPGQTGRTAGTGTLGDQSAMWGQAANRGWNQVQADKMFDLERLQQQDYLTGLQGWGAQDASDRAWQELQLVGDRSRGPGLGGQLTGLGFDLLGQAGSRGIDALLNRYLPGSNSGG